jgi:hypothetical protein
VFLDLDLDSFEKVAGDVNGAAILVIVCFDEESVVAASCAKDVVDFVDVVRHFDCLLV